jgi:hypothetical protein
VIPGYETRELILAQIEALEREAKGHIRGERHLKEIRNQIKVFTKELKRLEAEGDPVVEKRRGRATTTRNSTTGQTYQQWVN